MSSRLASGAALSLAVGCGESEAEVAAAMERALGDAHVALAGVLVGDEVLIHAHETPDTELRHGSDDCGCPCTERAGSPPSTFVLTLDYHDSACVPDSGLVPSPLSGRVVVTVGGAEVDATLDGAVLGYEHALTGRLEGTVEPSTLEVDARGPLELGARALELEVNLRNADASGIGIGGEVAEGAAVVRFEGVELPRDRVDGPCPTPTAGAIVITREGEDDVSVDLERPGVGSVTVTRGERISEAVPWCAFDSDLL